MNHHSMELLIEICLELLSILPYPFDTYKDITLNRRRLAIIKGYYIGESVMSQILNVHTRQIPVGAKNEIHCN